jgi:hypothetical protein
MDGNNLRFRTNPRAFLETHTLVCFGATKFASQTAAINRVNGNTLGVQQEFAPTVEFDLVTVPAGYVDLVILGVIGSYSKFRFGQPIVGNYIPYLGQKDRAPTSTNYGRINLTRVTTNYVFTFSFTGCNFVVTRENGDVYVYHEPTSPASNNVPVATRYPNATAIINPGFGPLYDDTHVGGFGCMVRDSAIPTRWHLYAQSPTGLKMTAGRLSTTTVDV